MAITSRQVADRMRKIIPVPRMGPSKLSDKQVEKLVRIMSNPRQYQIPVWVLNRQKDIKDGNYSQIVVKNKERKLREEFVERMKIRARKGLRPLWGFRVRGQHTKTTGRRGRTVGISKKK